ncbi:MAG: hypothetical protein JW779_10835 [Candidatus Thorarchaeota archaeon]|nr:hypothetical protein [Candidatus Thorarchaeota archaeon]
MKAETSDLKRKILLTLDECPLSIYDIIHSISDFSDPKRTRLPKLLKSMESEKLVVSALQPGPLGPYRRMYEQGPDADEYLIDSLKNGLEIILHFYNAFRSSYSGGLYNLGHVPNVRNFEGTILFAAFPHLTVDNLIEIRDVLASSKNVRICIIGSDEILSKTGIDYKTVGSDLLKIETKDETFNQISMRGVPPRTQLPYAISECKRVLTKGGILKITAPLVFFDEPAKPTLSEFIRITGNTMFPELGIVEGLEIRTIMKKHFSNYGEYEKHFGEVVFWGIKS